MNHSFCFDFHIHSYYSFDSLLSPREIIKKAYLKQLNAIAITDHNTIKGGMQGKSVKQDEVMVVVGSEINTDYGDLIGLFLNEEIKSRVFLEVIDEIKRQDGIVFLPHPYRRKRFPDSELLKSIDVLEGINARTSEELNLSGQKLAKDLQKPMMAGSDAHLSFELGRVWNVADNMFSFDEEKLRKKILKGEVEMCGKGSHYLMRKTGIVLGTIMKKIRTK